jgi:hypothetical protein
MKEIVVSTIGIIGGLLLVLYSSRFATRATSQKNVFGTANAAAGKGAVRMGPLLVGCFLILIGVLTAFGVMQPK